MVSKFYNSIKTFLFIIKAGIRFGWEEEIAHPFNNWANIISTFFYNITFYTFIRVLFYNVDNIAGYNLDESLVVLLFAQIMFYISYAFYIGNVHQIAKYVNDGFLDTLLVRPLPTLTYLSFHKIYTFSFIRDGIPSLVILVFAINWDTLNSTPSTVAASIIVFILGVIANLFFNLLFVLPAFWFEKNDSFVTMTHKLQWLSRREIPYEGFTSSVQAIFTYVLPLFIATLLSASVLLSKTPIWEGLLKSFSATVIFSISVYIFWRISLRRYVSASS